MPSIVLTSEEQALLKQHYTKARSRLIRERAHAILLADRNRGAQDISQILMRKQDTIREWLHRFDEARLSSIFPRYTDNQNANKLTSWQKKKIAQTLKSPPQKYGLPQSFWSVSALKEYVSATYGVVYESKRSYHHLFTVSGYSFKLPSPFDRRRDEELVARRLREISLEIQPYLASSDWVVLCADETRVVWETEVRRAWLTRGSPTVLKVERKKTAQSYFGALNQKTGRHHLIAVPWQTSDTIAAALMSIVNEYPNKRVCVIWDNASWHKGMALRNQLGKGNPLERVHLVNLPPYAPDKNPEEHVWRVGKDAISNELFTTFDLLKRQFEYAVTSQTFEYRIATVVS